MPHLALKTILISICIGLAFGTWLYFTYDHRPARILISILTSCIMGSLMMTLIHYRHWFTLITPQPTGKIIMMIVLLSIAALFGTWLINQLRSWIWQETINNSDSYILNILILLVTGIPIYVGESSKSTLQQQNTISELELIRARINPHFLYNMHNTIAGLISKDPAKAETLILLLSKFFRFTLHKDSAGFHSIADETTIITTYLQMQQIRFEDKMQYTITVSPDTWSLKIPSFILQPLVENAVKYGIETTGIAGIITVNIISSDHHLAITITDPGPPFPDHPGTGHGLAMVIQKLNLLYQDNYTLELKNTPEKYVRITLPTNYQNIISR